MIGAEIVDKLIQARKDQGLSVRALAARSGYSVSGIYTWERRQHTMNLREACDLAEALGMEIIIRPKETAK